MAVRLFKMALGILLVAFCSCSGSAPVGGSLADIAETTDPGAVIEAHERLIRAVEANDVDTLVGLLDRSSEFLIFHPRLVSRIDKIEEVVHGFDKMSRRMGAMEWTEVHAVITRQGDVAWLTSNLLVEGSTLEEPFLGRATEIWVLRVDGWKLAHGHWSSEVSGP